MRSDEGEIFAGKEIEPVLESLYQLKKKIELQYPEQNYYDVYEYRNTETDYVEDYDVNKLAQEIIYSVSIYDYEVEKNEKKRNIKVLQPAFIDEFIRFYYAALNS